MEVRQCSPPELPAFCLQQIHEEVLLDDDFTQPSAFRSTQLTLLSDQDSQSFFVCGDLLAEVFEFSKLISADFRRAICSPQR